MGKDNSIFQSASSCDLENLHDIGHRWPWMRGCKQTSLGSALKGLCRGVFGVRSGGRCAVFNKAGRFGAIARCVSTNRVLASRQSPVWPAP